MAYRNVSSVEIAEVLRPGTQVQPAEDGEPLGQGTDAVRD